MIDATRLRGCIATMSTRSNIVLAFVLVLSILLLREIVRYLFSSWLAFCVFYTVSDLYRKRKFAIKYYKLAQRYGIIPDLTKLMPAPPKKARQKQVTSQG